MSDLNQINKDAINVLNTETLVDGTFKDIVDSYSLTAEILKLSQRNINESLINKGVATTLDAKLSTVPEKILDLPNMGGTLEIVPPNVGALIDTNDREYNVTKIKSEYSIADSHFGANSSYGSKNTLYTDNYIVWFVASEYILYKKYSDDSFSNFSILGGTVQSCCSSYIDDEVYIFGHGSTSTKTNLYVYDLSFGDSPSLLNTYHIDDCNEVAWCDTINGTIYVAYKEHSSGDYRLGIYKPGDSFITNKITLFTNLFSDITYDDKYLYISYDNAFLYYISLGLTEGKLSSVRLENISQINRITPIGDKLLIHDSRPSIRLFNGIDSSDSLKFITIISLASANISVAIDDEYFVCGHYDSPYARMYRMTFDSSTGKYVFRYISDFYNINQGGIVSSRMIIGIDSKSNKYLLFSRDKSILVQGIVVSDLEFELERRV